MSVSRGMSPQWWVVQYGDGSAVRYSQPTPEKERAERWAAYVPGSRVLPVCIGTDPVAVSREQYEKLHADLLEWAGDDLVALSMGHRAALRAVLSQAARALASRVGPVPVVVGGERELAEMEARKDDAYLERNQVVAALASAFPSGVARTAIEGWSEDWHGCVYIDLPTGQASWHFHDSQAHMFAHLPPYKGQWDGHTTEEKYERLAALASRIAEPREMSGREQQVIRFARNLLATSRAVGVLGATEISDAEETLERILEGDSTLSSAAPEHDAGGN